LRGAGFCPKTSSKPFPSSRAGGGAEVASGGESGQEFRSCPLLPHFLALLCDCDAGGGGWRGGRRRCGGE
jgi:hypothetical protein